MIWRLPLLGAILTGACILGLSLYAALYRVPPLLGEGVPVTLVLDETTAGTGGSGLDPAWVTALIVAVSMAGLVLLFFFEVMQPKAGLKVRAASRRLRDADVDVPDAPLG